MTRILIDTHILIGLLDDASTLPPMVIDLIGRHDVTLAASVVSIWEIAIKVRIGKLPFAHDMAKVPQLIVAIGFHLLPISAEHVVHELDAWPDTKDPFDRLLLQQCAVEELRLATWDSALVRHPLAWRA